MSQKYTPELKKKIVRLHEEEGRTYKGITAEYGVSKASISKWCREFSKERHVYHPQISLFGSILLSYFFNSAIGSRSNAKN